MEVLMTISEMLFQTGLLAVFIIGIVVGCLLIMTFKAPGEHKGSSVKSDDKVISQAPAMQTAVHAAKNALEPSLVSSGVVAAITAAVNEYRKNNT